MCINVDIFLVISCHTFMESGFVVQSELPEDYPTPLNSWLIQGYSWQTEEGFVQLRV